MTDLIPGWPIVGDVLDETKPAIYMEQDLWDTMYRRTFRFSPQQVNINVLNERAETRKAETPGQKTTKLIKRGAVVVVEGEPDGAAAALGRAVDPCVLRSLRGDRPQAGGDQEERRLEAQARRAHPEAHADPGDDRGLRHPQRLLPERGHRQRPARSREGAARAGRGRGRGLRASSSGATCSGSRRRRRTRSVRRRRGGRRREPGSCDRHLPQEPQELRSPGTARRSSRPARSTASTRASSSPSPGSSRASASTPSGRTTPGAGGREEVRLLGGRRSPR